MFVRPEPIIITYDDAPKKKSNIVPFTDPYAHDDGSPVLHTDFTETTPRALKSPIADRGVLPDPDKPLPKPATLRDYLGYFLYKLACVRYKKYVEKYSLETGNFDVKLNTKVGMRLWREALYDEFGGYDPESKPVVYARVSKSEEPYVNLDDTKRFSTIIMAPDKEGFKITGVDLRIVPGRFGYSVRRYYLLQADLNKKKKPMTRTEMIADERRRRARERDRLNPTQSVSPYDPRYGK